MKIKKIIVFIFCFLINNGLEAQMEMDQFNSAYKIGDVAKMNSVIKNWKAKEPENPDLIIAEFNLHYFKAVSFDYVEKLGFDADKDLMFVSPDGSLTSYIEKKAIYNPSDMELAEKVLQAGVKKHPNRLDFHFGLISLYTKTEKWPKYIDAIVASLDQSVTNDNNWKWTNDRVFEGTIIAYLNGLSEFQSELFTSNDDALLPYMRVVAEEIKKRYPTHLQSYSDIAISYILVEQYDEAISVLLEAEKYYPKDQILLGNIAYAYKAKGNSLMAIEYYKKVQFYGDREHAYAARQNIVKLQ